MNIKLLTKHHLEFLRLKGGHTGSSESALNKVPHCWKSHVTAHMSPTNLHKSNPEVGLARFSSAPWRWIDHDLALDVTVSIQCQANGGPRLCAMDQP